MTDYPRIKSQDLNRRERIAAWRIWRYYLRSEGYNGVTSVRFKLHRVCEGITSMSVRTRRSDCHPASPRAILCEERGLFFIGPRGGIKVSIAESGSQLGDRKARRSHRAHVARMLRAKTTGR